MIPLPEPLAEAWEAEWQPVGTAALAGVSLSLLLLAVLAIRSDQGWIPLLDGVNLVFHEAGHPLFGLLGWEALTILGGTLMQLLVPTVAATSFWLRRDAVGATVTGIWVFENLLNIARYVADARAQALPLVGGGEHDWATLLGRWGLLAQDTTLARGLQSLGWLGMVGCWAWLAWQWHRSRPEQA
ncbi:hypothetical protein [Geothrix fuzhouensis]|uniref:hypothetical protein n=1 Tax=Geothrix fuzhouensis TaxID=2966451 RepID=UPI0021473A61|nr:hypothetical protein [Geothrix fuzhouensis]